VAKGVGFVKKDLRWISQLNCQLHNLVAFEEALEWGVFRSGEVSIAGTLYKPPFANKLDAIFSQGIEYLNSIINPLERAIAMFLFGSLNQFFYDERTSRLMMNGILLSNGFDAINVPAKKKLEFNQSMIAFYDTQQADKIMDFMVNCFNNSSGVQDLSWISNFSSLKPFIAFSTIIN